MSQTWKVFFACALGAFIGTLVALQINHNFWWVGLLAGFGVGYLTYESKKVAAAVPAAWRRATNWRPDRAWWKACFQFVIAVTGIGTSLFITVLLFISTTDGNLNVLRAAIHRPSPLAATLAVSWVAFVVFVFFGTATSLQSTELLREEARILAHFNPFSIYLWYIPKYALKYAFLAVWYLPAAIRFAYPRVARAGGVIGRFAYHLFKLIHSELCLLCGVDAAIGVAIGHFYHSALIGAVAGGLFGVLNFELLSVRVLKLVPKSASIFH